MSIFNCNITFKMVEGDSLASTKNKLVAHNIIKEDWSIISLNKARIAIQELNEEAKEVLGVSVQMFEEDGVTVYPNVDEFDRIDRLKKFESILTNLNYKETEDELPDLFDNYNEYIPYRENKLSQANIDRLKIIADVLDNFSDKDLFNLITNNLKETYDENSKFLSNRNFEAWLGDIKVKSIRKDIQEYKEGDRFKGKDVLKSIVGTDFSNYIDLITPDKNTKYQSSNKQIQNLSNEATDWIKSVLPNANIELQQDLIDGIANGSFNTVNELITLSEKYANKKTAKHEMFHLAFNRLSKQKQDELLNEGSRLFNISRGESEVTTKYSLSQQNEINYALKSVDILQSDKAKQIFEKGEKNKWDLDKILIELAIPKEQRILIKDLNKTKREGILIELLNNYNYTVEINIAKNQEVKDYLRGNRNIISLNGEYIVLLPDGELGETITEEEYLKEVGDLNENSKYYSNLTVLGGTNYTEQEIATPLIIPSIKGHAQFATDFGIGWFRSDEQDSFKRQPVKSITEVPDNFTGVNNYTFLKIKEGWLIQHPNQEDEIETNEKEIIEMYNYGSQEYSKLSKTRRILELQSDLFQKGRDRVDLVSENKIKEFEESLQRDKYNATRLFNSQIEEINYINESLYEQGIISKQEMVKSIKIESESLTLDSFKQQELELNILQDKLNNQNQFLQLLNKDGNWVTFFTKAIIQDSVKKGYEKILFPTGNTASKVEGHTTLEEFKKQKEDRIKKLEKNKQRQVNGKAILYDVDENSFATEPTIVDVSILDKEINQLKQELEDVEKNGFGALKPIYNFYENTVTNILKKQGFSPKLITDEYGNTWNEIDLNDVKVKEQIQTIKFQSPKLEYKGDLAIEEKIAEMMENTPDEKLPKTILGRWIQSVKNFFRNLFKERTKIQQLLRNINQGRIKDVNKQELINQIRNEIITKDERILPTNTGGSDFQYQSNISSTNRIQSDGSNNNTLLQKVGGRTFNQVWNSDFLTDLERERYLLLCLQQKLNTGDTFNRNLAEKLNRQLGIQVVINEGENLPHGLYITRDNNINIDTKQFYKNIKEQEIVDVNHFLDLALSEELIHILTFNIVKKQDAIDIAREQGRKIFYHAVNVMYGGLESGSTLVETSVYEYIRMMIQNEFFDGMTTEQVMYKDQPIILKILTETWEFLKSIMSKPKTKEIIQKHIDFINDQQSNQEKVENTLPVKEYEMSSTDGLYDFTCAI